MRRFPRAAHAAALALLVSLSLAACGDKDTTAQPDGNSSTESEPAGDSGGGALTQGDFNKRIFSAIEKAGSAKVRFESGAGGSKVTGDGEVKYGDELAMRMKMSAPGATGGMQEVLLIGDTFYLGMGGQYMAMPLDSMSGQGMPDLSTNLDPKVQAKAFDKAITGFEQKGAAETIDGVKATPYDITVDPTKAPDAFGKSVTEPLSFTYYIGPDNLPRKMVFHGKDGDFSATYTDWGVPVDIKAPPASKMMKAPGGMGNMGGIS